ncbi:MAG: hypothetical protein QOF53_985 [Nocardioidaceae bacterium]|nr:hypothetical protein [Nocardioidaceae bacterium]
MGIGVGIFLIAVGAILAFAVDYSANNVDISAVGWILMAAGAVGILLDLIVFAPRRRVVGRPGAVVEERRVYEDDSRY